MVEVVGYDPTYSVPPPLQTQRIVFLKIWGGCGLRSHLNILFAKQATTPSSPNPHVYSKNILSPHLITFIANFLNIYSIFSPIPSITLPARAISLPMLTINTSNNNVGTKITRFRSK